MSSVSSSTCEVCKQTENLLRCARCKQIYYCSKAHQKQDWKKHKLSCQKAEDPVAQKCEKNYVNTVKTQNTSVIPTEGSSENEILNSRAEYLSPNPNYPPDEQREKSSTEKALRPASTAMPVSGENITIVQPRPSSAKDFPEIALPPQYPPFLHRNQDSVIEEMCRNVILDMDAYGVCVVDNFLGEDQGKSVLAEVLHMYTQGNFKDGQLVSSTGRRGDLKTIRGDQIMWVDGREKNCKNIGYLISQVDAVIMRANKMMNNGKLGNYNINGRTKVKQLLHHNHHDDLCLQTNE